MRELPSGLSEWAVHPSVATRQTRAIAGGRLVRRTDHDLLISPAAHDLVRRHDITLIDYRVVQHAWSRPRHDAL
ncbi:hypothetical protein [Nonomuraea rhodomycinica]|uniref:Uncharacterized protein n=1 Tax=Nonomuraea rhodomycinica TaxID=1712872 RepID=A0A7Y6IXT6_9ACTN|nr:hypothetical protein [Nonomuraea rhodomycinica]NUW46125.1 hypothetical protein [Nonomuraea rhodomycinica]